MATAVVTGATGFIGKRLVPALLRCNHNVSVITRTPGNVLPEWRNEVEIIKGDISDSRFGIPQNCEILYHCAGSINDPRLFYAANVRGTQNVLNECRKLPDFKRFVHLSSVGVMGCRKSGRYDETTPCSPRNTYEQTKLKAEQMVLDAAQHFPTTVLRPSIVFGPGRKTDQDSFYRLVKAIASGRFILFGNEQAYFNIVYIDDVVQALLMLGTAVDKTIKGRCFIVNDPVNWPDFCKYVSETLNVKDVKCLPKLFGLPAAAIGTCLSRLGIKAPLTLQSYSALTTGVVFDAGRIGRDLLFRPQYGVRKGIEETLQHYQMIDAR